MFIDWFIRIGGGITLIFAIIMFIKILKKSKKL